jgi:lysophospholipase L1-like esterase
VSATGRSWRRHAVAILAAAVATLVLLEAALRALEAATGAVPPHADLGIWHEWRWARAHLDAGAPVFPGDHVFDRELGWRTKPDLRTPLLRTNAAGMRANREFARERTPGVRRIVLVGDSYTMGATVADADAWGAVLGREHLPGWEVLNLGVSGYGVDQAVRRFARDGAPYRPDVAVLGFYVRDFQRNLTGFRSYAKPYFTLDPAGALVLHDDHVLAPESLFEEYRSGRRRIGGWRHLRVWGALGQAWALRVREGRIGPGSASWRLMAALLRRFAGDARAAGAAPFLLTIPTRPGAYRGTVYEDVDRLALAEARALGVPALRLADSFHAAPDETRPAPFFRDPSQGGHLTEAGNAELARLLAEALRAAGLAEPSR